MQKKKMKLKKSVKNKLYTLLILVFSAVFFYSAFQLITIYRQNYEERQEIEGIADKIGIPDQLNQETKIDWQKLKEINSDIIAWIYIPGTNISYPVVQGKDNSYYLTHSFEKKSNKSGAIFADKTASTNFSDRNTFLYGHNMKHGTMFAQIEKFKDKDFYNTNRELYLYTPEMNYKGIILGMTHTDSSSDLYRSEFKSDEDFLKYMEDVQKQSIVSRKEEMSAQDRIITLSTCAYENDSSGATERYVLHAKLEEIKE